jgi:hypothetical protein
MKEHDWFAVVVSPDQIMDAALLDIEPARLVFDHG